MEKTLIKPHHLLDIFKLYGKGIEKFVPNPNYNHNFFLVGNSVINNKVITIQFTSSSDDICKPCIFLKNNTCADKFTYMNEVHIKNDYNENLDIKLMSLLEIRSLKDYEFKYIVELLNKKLSLDLINQVWDNCDKKDNMTRYKLTRDGLDKYINRYMKVTGNNL